jgi:prolyl-tRNA synthetase
LNRAKSFVPVADVATAVPKLLDELQAELLASARARRDAATHPVDGYDAFKEKLESEAGGFVLAHWCGETSCETAIHEETKATVRVITFDGPKEAGACVRCGNPSARRVHFAKAY